MIDRRGFLVAGTSCMAHLTLMASALPGASRRLWTAAPTGTVVSQEAWGRLELVSEGVWALISTPLQDRTTLCNGGIIAGRDGVLVVESFASAEGARWIAEQATRLTGQAPTHVVLTHYHGDHTGGITGFDTARPTESPDLRMTETTRTLVREADQDTTGGPQDSRVTLLDGAELLSATAPTTVDLGGRRVRVVPRSGHTSSDVTVELDDPSIVFCGDLVWNEMFPNYVDAVPSALSASVRGLLREETTYYVPGHGPMADRDALNRFVMILDHVEAAARAAFEGGQSAAEAAAGYSLPPEVGEWFLFNPAYFERALGAWHRELAGTNG